MEFCQEEFEFRFAGWTTGLSLTDESLDKNLVMKLVFD